MIDLDFTFSSNAHDADITVQLLAENQALTGVLARAADAARFTGKKEQVCEILGGESGTILLLGIGDPKKLSGLDAEKIGATLWKKVSTSGAVSICVSASQIPTASLVGSFANGVRLRAYSFDKYKTKKPKEEKVTVESVNLICSQPVESEASYNMEVAVSEGVHFARDLVAEVPNVLYPEAYATTIKAELEPLGVKVEVLDEAQMAGLGMGALLGVGQGSVKESRLVVMHWNGGEKSDAPLAFVGKGVTFDTGGISIKPAAGMWDMKFDMGGSAAVVGLMKAVARRESNQNIIGVVGLVENMPDGNAQRPGDIVTSMSGQTIQVLNTDAEGRLVLADALWYTQDRFQPKFMIDLATLTGAMLVALGMERAGVFSNSDDLPGQLFKAGEATGDRVWHMPIGPEYNKQIDSKEADVANIGGGRWGGSITAACFLERFVNGVPWAHLDIAGTAWGETDKPLSGVGATGFGVRLLDRFLRDNFEK
ncbi:MAG: leucyl aminopeptidase [Alphaproteobacteria bacterium]